MHDLKLRMT